MYTKQLKFSKKCMKCIKIYFFDYTKLDQKSIYLIVCGNKVIKISILYGC